MKLYDVNVQSGKRRKPGEKTQMRVTKNVERRSKVSIAI